MRLDCLAEYRKPRVVAITLSRRNLLALLTKLDHPESERTLIKEEDGLMIHVSAEPDEDHYRDRPEGPPGPMIDYTEVDIRRLEQEGIQ